jgi:hypothetical protein
MITKIYITTGTTAVNGLLVVCEKYLKVYNITAVKSKLGSGGQLCVLHTSREHQVRDVTNKRSVLVLSSLNPDKMEEGALFSRREYLFDVKWCLEPSAALPR